MKYEELKKEFLNFFEKNDHTIVPSSSLNPVNSSVLFTTAGMQQFTSYLSGEKDVMNDFGNRRLTSCQKCFRTGDIDEVGDETHHTFFEMLGNWSIGKEGGGYFKEEAINYALDFLLNVLKIDKDKLSVTIFKGNKDIPRDNEARNMWIKKGISEDKISEFEKDNFWGPVGDSGPCGPSSEIFYDKGSDFGCGEENCGPNCDKCNRFVEIWNLVFMEYLKENNGSFRLLDQKNVDTGMGLERMLSILQNKSSAYQTDIFSSIIQKIEKISSAEYSKNKRTFRVLADHIRGVVFLASEGIYPSNLGQGYVLRRLLRRIVRFGKMINMDGDFMIVLAKETIERYKEFYPIIKTREEEILNTIHIEQTKFLKTLEKGIKFTSSLLEKGDIDGGKAFFIYESYGFPIEMIEELAKEGNRIIVNKDKFYDAKKKHQEVSRAGVENKFGGVGKNANYQSAKLHTATHLLHQALRVVLGDEVQQKGSDINPQRLRFDFSYHQKIEKDNLDKVENLVNEKIKDGLDIRKEEMSLEEALKSDVLAFFKEKYPKMVNVYFIGDFSKEICAGPHANNTNELGHFKILKEKSSGSGVRRIRAIIE